MGCCFRAGAESTAKSLTLPVDKTSASNAGLIHPTCYQWCAVYASVIKEKILLWGWIKKSFSSPKRDIGIQLNRSRIYDTLLNKTVSYISYLILYIMMVDKKTPQMPVKSYLTIVAAPWCESRHILLAGKERHCPSLMRIK